MKCPNCGVNLVMTERKGIEIDYCPDCRGVWLDRGELDKIIERSLQDFKDDYNEIKRYPSDKDYYYKKKKGFLGDLFDF
ncbi:MAG: zf-TFIIB domain-containing protein [Melioribacter sp.]|uniref:TFIIB-type zinc ribbon-containing protein n=1 Tax=Rosettibacter primus TaxID=3111523 RepID=UPI00247B8C79|nr:zf-TFIIB domain-containing protein [Melioribacter sp.]